jgi:hypothetical protein
VIVEKWLLHNILCFLIILLNSKSYFLMCGFLMFYFYEVDFLFKRRNSIMMSANYMSLIFLILCNYTYVRFWRNIFYILKKHDIWNLSISKVSCVYSVVIVSVSWVYIITDRSKLIANIFTKPIYKIYQSFNYETKFVNVTLRKVLKIVFR